LVVGEGEVHGDSFKLRVQSGKLTGYGEKENLG
jgi:hypothetical protein